jgi:hypothetical protein
MIHCCFLWACEKSCRSPGTLRHLDSYYPFSPLRVSRRMCTRVRLGSFWSGAETPRFRRHTHVVFCLLSFHCALCSWFPYCIDSFSLSCHAFGVSSFPERHSVISLSSRSDPGRQHWFLFLQRTMPAHRFTQFMQEVQEGMTPQGQIDAAGASLAFGTPLGHLLHLARTDCTSSFRSSADRWYIFLC